MSDVTIKNLRSKIDQLLTLNNRIKELKAEETEINKTMMPIEAEIVNVMEAMDMNRFEGSIGKVTLQKQDYVTTPKDAAKEQFFEYLKAEGIFDNLASINYQTLNSWFKEKNEQAIAEGEPLNIPGLERMTRTTLVKRK